MTQHISPSRAWVSECPGPSMAPRNVDHSPAASVWENTIAHWLLLPSTRWNIFQGAKALSLATPEHLPMLIPHAMSRRKTSRVRLWVIVSSHTQDHSESESSYRMRRKQVYPHRTGKHIACNDSSLWQTPSTPWNPPPRRCPTYSNSSESPAFLDSHLQPQRETTDINPQHSPCPTRN